MLVSTCHEAVRRPSASCCLRVGITPRGFNTTHSSLWFCCSPPHTHKSKQLDLLDSHTHKHTYLLALHVLAPARSLASGPVAARTAAAVVECKAGKMQRSDATLNRSSLRSSSKGRGDKGKHKCDMPWDRPAVKEGSMVRAVAASVNMGFIGNKLFAIAAAIALADAMRLPLAIPWKVTSALSRKGFPCLRTSPSLKSVSRSSLHYVRPNQLYGSNFQDLSIWGTSNGSGLPTNRPHSSEWLDLMRRSIRPIADNTTLAPLPADDDLVIHFRDLRDCAGWKSAGNGTKAASTYRTTRRFRWFYQMDLFAPPQAFYDLVISKHMVQHPHARVWLVSQPCERMHPTILALRSRWRLHFLKDHDDALTCTSAASCKSAGLDFVWMLAARHLVLSPSTFGWWPAFLSLRAEAIHFPIYPPFSPWGAHMWCHILPEDDPRYLFHDAWEHVTWRGGTSGGREARRRCDVYIRACLKARICATDAQSAAAARSALPFETIDDFTYLDDHPLSISRDLKDNQFSF